MDTLLTFSYYVSGTYSTSETSARGVWYNGSSYSIPNMWFDGTINRIGVGTVEQTYTQYKGDIQTRLAISSPLTLEFTDVFLTPESGSITTLIKVIENISKANLKLRVVLAENPVGQYTHVVRDILPVEALSISLVGDSAVITKDFTIDPGWSYENMEIGAFVQDDDDKEILQACGINVASMMPLLYYISNTIDDSGENNNGRAEPGETVNLIVEVGNIDGFRNAESVVVYLSTEDAMIAVLDSSSSFPNIASGGTENNTGDPFVFFAESLAPVHIATFNILVTAQPGDFTRSDSFSMMIGFPDLILVDDDGGENFEEIYAQTFDSLSLLYDYWETTGKTLDSTLALYPYCVWFTGAADSATLTPDEQNALADYLDNGGRLFITGQSIGDEIGDSAFYSDYLHAELINPTSHQAFFYGVPGDPIGDGLTLRTPLIGASHDVILPINGATSCFTVSGDSAVALKYDAKAYKLVYFGFRFERIYDIEGYAPKHVVMERVFQWLGLLGVEEEIHEYKPFMSLLPNPVDRYCNISFELKNPAHVSLKVYGITGREVKTLVNGNHGPGLHSVHWETNSLPTGVYFCRLLTDTEAYTRKVVILH